LTQEKAYLTGSEEMEVLPEAMLFNLRIIFMVADSTHNPPIQTLNPSNPTRKNPNFFKLEEREPQLSLPTPHFPATKPTNKLKTNTTQSC